MEKKINIDLLYKQIKDKNITLYELSQMTNISPAHLCMMFNQKRNITIEKLNKIIEVAKININDITE